MHQSTQADESLALRMGGNMEWSRGAVIGRGSFSTVSLAFLRHLGAGPNQLPPVMAVKSAPLPLSALLRHESAVLSDLQDCPYVLRRFGDQVTADSANDGGQFYNLFLEYIPGGSLHDALRRAGGSLREPTVRRYARSILLGLSYAHARGYAHCDIKPQNILVGGGGGEADVKIADFGLAKKVGEKIGDGSWIRGTPLYMAPESVARGEYGAAADVWAVGCVVTEMTCGRPAWGQVGCGDAWELLCRIGSGEESPAIPKELSEEGRDFLQRCFRRDPAERWTAEMLLRHPFIMAEEEDGLAESSPRSVFGLSEWSSPRSASESYLDLAESRLLADPDSSIASLVDRIKELATTQRPNWASNCSSDAGWVDVIRGPDISSSLKLEEMVHRGEYRTERDEETIESGDMSSSATIQHAFIPSLALQSEDRTDYASNSSRITHTKIADDCFESSLNLSCRIHVSSVCSVREKDCKVDSSSNQYSRCIQV